MDALQRYERAETLTRRGLAVMHGVTTAGTAYALMRASAVPALPKMGGAAAIMTGAASLVLADKLESSKVGSLAQIAGGAGLLFAKSPTALAASTALVAAGSLVGFIDQTTHNNPANWYKNTLKGAALGAAVGIGATIKSGIATSVIGLAAGAAVGGVIGAGVDNLSHRAVIPGLMLF
jgi:hypothetical protein